MSRRAPFVWQHAASFSWLNLNRLSSASQIDQSTNGTMSNLSLHCLQQANRANTGGRVVLKDQLSVLKIISIFLLKSEKGSNMSLQSKACLPAVKMLLTLKCSMSNVEDFSALSPDLKLLLEIISISNEIYATGPPLNTVGDTALNIILRNTALKSRKAEYYKMTSSVRRKKHTSDN